MKTLLFTLIVAVFTFNLTSCTSEAPKEIESTPVVEAPTDLLQYSVHNEEITDTPAKTQVKLDVLIEGKDMDEQKIRDLMNYLFSTTSIRSGFKHHTQPTNIYIYVYTSKDKANAGMGQWIGMLSKNQSETEPSLSISDIQLRSLNEVDAEKWGLTSEQRHEIWDKSIHIEDEANRQVDIKYPDTVNDHEKRKAMWKKLTSEGETELAKEYGVEKAIVDSVSREGLLNGWAFPN